MAGFISEYRDFILEHIPTSPDWAEGIATSLLATALGPKRKITTRYGPLNLNLFFMIIGPSGLAYKTAPLRYFTFPVLADLTRKTKSLMILPSRFSLEGLIQYLAKRSSSGCIVRDEVSTIFKETAMKGYLTDIMEFFSELYDGMLQKRFTRKTQLEEAQNVFITFLGASTPYLFKVMKPDFFMQGTGNRILYVWYEGPEDVPKYTGEEFFLDWEATEMRNRKLVGYSQILAALRAAPFEIITPIDEAGEELAGFKHAMEIEAKKIYKGDTFSLDVSYLARLPEFAYKLAALHAVSKSYESLPRSELPELMVTKDDADWAINKVKIHFEHFKAMRDRWSAVVAEEPLVLKIAKDPVERVCNFIKESGSGGVKIHEVYSRFGLLKRDLDPIIDTLVSQGRVQRLIFKTGGRPTIKLVSS